MRLKPCLKLNFIQTNVDVSNLSLSWYGVVSPQAETLNCNLAEKHIQKVLIIPKWLMFFSHNIDQQEVEQKKKGQMTPLAAYQACGMGKSIILEALVIQ